MRTIDIEVLKEFGEQLVERITLNFRDWNFKEWTLVKCGRLSKWKLKGTRLSFNSPNEFLANFYGCDEFIGEGGIVEFVNYTIQPYFIDKNSYRQTLTVKEFNSL